MNFLYPLWYLWLQQLVVPTACLLSFCAKMCECVACGAFSSGPLTQFAHSLEPHLRQLGLPVLLKKGVWCGVWGWVGGWV